MLFIKRAISQGVYIGEDIEVIVKGVENGLLVLGIQAPNDRRIIRTEDVKSEVIHQGCCAKTPKEQMSSRRGKRIFLMNLEESKDE